MQMVRGGGAAHGAVVEDRKILIHLREEQHVREVMPDGLGEMLVAGHHEVVLEDGIGVDLDVIVAVLFAFVFDVELLLGAVRRAEETGPGGDGFLIYLRGGGDDAAGVQLHGHIQSAYVEMPVFCRFEGAEVRGGHRPYRELVLYEFVDVCHAIRGRTTGLLFG